MTYITTIGELILNTIQYEKTSMPAALNAVQKKPTGINDVIKERIEQSNYEKNSTTENRTIGKVGHVLAFQKMKIV
jgi:hypothetical protein